MGHQPFTAPEVKPATILRWNSRTITRIGTVTITAAAANVDTGALNWSGPTKNASCAVTGLAAVVEVSETPKTKSFQAKKNVKIAAVKTPGAARGTITFRNACHEVAPSTWAACRCGGSVEGLLLELAGELGRNRRQVSRVGELGGVGSVDAHQIDAVVAGGESAGQLDALLAGVLRQHLRLDGVGVGAALLGDYEARTATRASASDLRRPTLGLLGERISGRPMLRLLRL